MNASAHMTCAGPQSALRLQSPVCGQPLVTRKKHHRVNSLPTRPPGCGAEVCSIRGGGSSHLVPAGPPMDLPCNTPSSGSGSAQQRASVVARAAHHSSAASASAATAEKAKWWKRDAELWVDVHTEEEFEAAVTTGDKLVLVDFFATWCHGCQKSYPELCRFARDPELASKVKFVKVCIEELKRPAKEAGVKSLPHAVLYQPGRGKLVGIDIPPSKVKNLKVNLLTVLKNPDMDFKSDPNGFIVPTPRQAPAAAAADEAARAAAAAALEAGSAGLGDRLMAAATGNGHAAAAAAAAPAPATSSGNSHSFGLLGATAPLPPPPVQRPQLDAATQEAKAAFLREHGAQYGYQGRIDDLYWAEVGDRMRPHEHYLDYTGSSVYANSQLTAAFSELRRTLFGNPHSANPSSARAGEAVEEARDLILQYFNADPAEYAVVFTRSATDALKTVGEAYPWGPGSEFAYLRENHNSVLGVREYALAAGGRFHAINESTVEAWTADTTGAALADFLNAAEDVSSGPRGAPADAAAARAGRSGRASAEATLADEDEGADSGASGVVHNLFAFPAEDNFAGVKYPLSWIEKVRAKSRPNGPQWRVLLDAAAYVPTQPLDLRAVSPDFVAMSFYKIFGYPTGLGALVVRVDAAAELRKLFWGGGSVALATSADDFRVLKCRPSDAFEDGTVSFLDITALKHGFALIERLGGITAIQSHVESLRAWGAGALTALRHSNGAPMVRLFGKHGAGGAAVRQVQGGILNFALLKPDGSLFSYKAFEQSAADAGLHVRTGAECNPGACYAYLGVRESEVEALAGSKEGCHDDVEYAHVERAEVPRLHGAVESVDASDGGGGRVRMVDVPLGSVRASLGYLSTFEDVHALVTFIKDRYRDRADEP